MHVAGFWLLWQEGALEYGGAYSKSSQPARSLLIVELVTDEMTQRLAPAQELTPALERSGTATRSGPSIETNKITMRMEANPQSTADQDYLPAERLTRLPEPAEHIDPNLATINDIPFAGQIQLTVLIDANGMVADVITSVESNDARILAERIAAHFKDARFIPGEIDGKAVKSRLQITVVGKSPLTPQVL